ncbi:glycoside hydrolase family 99-like domain-containing protein [Methylovorus sp. MP688]|uniref:glycosyltransferase WbsX family protein n=1 Tax=Methylovorus sp. (strain MP688) TaxID=887061 RepID=UPI001EE64E6D|nr:glycoside hydrolase family 99-like domain-containing protein [Methylovorus sp. MP688]
MMNNKDKESRVIAFYLPQFHPIPENNKWWGNGFTEWTNVAKARPKFWGHYQPHIPADLGFYDLRMAETRIAQAELAREYGVNGFCYYHYWFNGKMLLETPIEAMIKEGQPDFPFCICWANESWSRRWDGRENELLIRQDLEAYNPEEHLDYLKHFFADIRYMRINDKPLILIYRIDQFPDIKNILDRWRKKSVLLGLSGLYICAVRSHMHRLADDETIKLGFDAIVDFEPHSSTMQKPNAWHYLRYFPARVINYLSKSIGLAGFIPQLPVLNVFDYKKLLLNAINSPTSTERKFPCVVPSWDKSARRRAGATVIQNHDPKLFELWLRNASSRVSKYPKDERIIFINAWNEWAEGCHLEPDLRHGHQFLEAVRNVFGSKKH